jgi:hypothetical protein
VIPAHSPNQPPELRARTLGEMLDAAMKIVGSNLKSLVPMAAGLVLPFQILIALVVVNAIKQPIFVKEGTKVRFIAPSAGQLGVLGGTLLLTFLATLVVTGALTWFVAEYYVGRKPTAGEAIRYALKHLPKLVLFSFAQILPFVLLTTVVLVLAFTITSNIFSLILFVLLLPVSIWLYIALSMTVPVLIVERLGLWAGMKRSVDLVKQYWWKVFGTLLVTGFLVGTFSSAVQRVVQSLLNSLGGDNKGFEFVWIAIAGTLATALITPISAAMSTLLYADLRIRKEGFDLEVLSASMPGPPSSFNSPGQL